MRWSGRLVVAGLLALGPVAAGSVSAVAANAETVSSATPTARPAGGYWQEEGRYSNQPDCLAMANSPLLSGRSECVYTDRYQDPWTLFVYYYT